MEDRGKNREMRAESWESEGRESLRAAEGGHRTRMESAGCQWGMVRLETERREGWTRKCRREAESARGWTVVKSEARKGESEARSDEGFGNEAAKGGKLRRG